VSARPSHHDQHLARIDAQNEHALRKRAERALALEAEREEHIRAREREVEHQRVAAPLVQEPAPPTIPPDPWGVIQRPERLDAPGERGEEFGGCIY
jgi:hypothetical protein